MNLKTIRPITDLRIRANELLKLSRKTDGPVVITQNGIAVGVIMDADVYEALQQFIEESRLIASMEAPEKDIKAGRLFTHKDLKNRIEKVLKGRKR